MNIWFTSFLNILIIHEYLIYILLRHSNNSWIFDICTSFLDILIIHEYLIYVHPSKTFLFFINFSWNLLWGLIMLFPPMVIFVPILFDRYPIKSGSFAFFCYIHTYSHQVITHKHNTVSLFIQLILILILYYHEFNTILFLDNTKYMLLQCHPDPASAIHMYTCTVLPWHCCTCRAYQYV